MPLLGTSSGICNSLLLLSAAKYQFTDPRVAAPLAHFPPQRLSVSVTGSTILTCNKGTDYSLLEAEPDHELPWRADLKRGSVLCRRLSPARHESIMAWVFA